MSGKTHIEEVTSGVTIPELKILEATVEVEKPSDAGLYNYCACGSGGGCGGAFDRTMRAARTQRV